MIRFDFAFAYISDCIELGRQIKSHLKLCGLKNADRQSLRITVLH